MFGKLISLLLSVIVITSACNSPTISEEMVKNAEMERYRAITQSDTTELGKYLADDFMYHQPTGRVINRSEYLYNTAEGSPAITFAEISENNVSVYDNVAISRGIVTIRYTLNDEPGEAELLFLNVWIYNDGRIQLAARQSSFI